MRRASREFFQFQFVIMLLWHAIDVVGEGLETKEARSGAQGQ